ncbi:MAG: triple tyrosine motif-containing protein [Paludibacter sp.]|nr:triple tyrosine motif-containing protein [Paludibacter sp.]
MRYYLIITLSFLSAINIFAQEFTPVVKQFTKNDYAAANQNWSVGQTSDGIMYFGNNLGLLSFDGSEWTIIKMPQNKIVRSIYVDKNDRIYVGSFEEFGYYTKNEKGQLQYTSLSDKLKSYDMRNDEIWNILNFNGEIIFQSFTSYFTFNQQGEVTGYRCPFTFLFFNIFRNKIYSHTSQLGFSYLDRKMQTFKPVEAVDLKNPLIAILPYNKTKSVIVTKSAGLFFYDGKTLQPFTTNADTEIKRGEVNKAIVSKEGNIIIGTILNGVLSIDRNGRKLWHLNTSNVLQNNTILGMYCDSNNNLWLTLDKGIALVQLNSKIRYLSAFNPSIGAIYSVTNRNNQVYIGTNQGLYRADLSTNNQNISNIRLEPAIKGQVWTINNFDDQILCGNNEETFELGTNQINRISPVKGGICIKKGVIHGKEVLVQGTYTDLCIYKKVNGKWQFSNSVEGFVNPIRYLEIDYTGTIWASHLHQGLYAIRLTPDLKKVDQMTLYKSLDQKNEYNINVFSINNRVVFTDHTAFYTFDDIRKKIIPYTELNSQLGYFSHAYRVCHFKNNLYWFIRSGEAALAKVAPDNTKILDIVQYGLFMNQTVDDYQNIIPVNQDECIFTLENGLAIYNLNAENKYKKTYNIKLKKVETLDAESKNIQFLTTNPKDIPSTPFSHNNIIFYVYYPQYENLNSIGFRYKLEGLDKVWGEPTGISHKEYNYLQPGSYTLKVQVVTQSGQKVSELSYHFEVLPPFYLSLTAKVIYLILSILILFGIYLYIKYLFHVKKEKIHQEQEEIRRKEIEKREQQILALEKEKLESELARKSKEMAESTMTIIKKNEILVKIKEEVIAQKNILGSQYPNKYYDKLIKILDENLTSEDDWLIFRTNFDRIHENFFRNLHTKYPELTSNDLRFCAYLRLNLSSKDIAHLMNISLKGVEVGRYRIRKKIGLESTKSLTEFMIEFK